MNWKIKNKILRLMNGQSQIDPPSQVECKCEFTFKLKTVQQPLFNQNASHMRLNSALNFRQPRRGLHKNAFLME